MAAVGAGDVIIAPQRFADADGHGFLADIEMGETGIWRRDRAGLPALQKADLQHLPVEMQSLVAHSVDEGFLDADFDFA